jgi:zinc finger SWIM domain-containing protein 3
MLNHVKTMGIMVTWWCLIALIRLIDMGVSFVPFVGLNNHRKTTVFGCAILSDETEHTYGWLLGTFLKATCQQKLKSIITDADAVA